MSVARQSLYNTLPQNHHATAHRTQLIEPNAAVKQSVGGTYRGGSRQPFGQTMSERGTGFLGCEGLMRGHLGAGWKQDRH
jgi:hypothetical protein